MTRKTPKEECINCGKLKPEPDMLYISPLDEYYCIYSQKIRKKQGLKKENADGE
ncbi:hypothetical protein LCGC14_1147220 [marine sediment metagenome]|uniref:Uncharacterized protein n=1 Tax=marine sediment metagenome TaxID=412755 RepID=A0A0F9M1H6_9ZZZZ